MPLRTKNQPLAGMAGGRVASCGLSGESKRTLSFCCYRYGAEIIRQTLLCRLGACREMPPTVPAGVDLCREILPGVPGPKTRHRKELLSGLRESLLCRQIPPGVPKSPWIRREKPSSVPAGRWALVHTVALRGAGRQGVVRRPAFLGKDARRRVQAQDFSACKSSQRYSIPCFSARVHSTWYTGRFFSASTCKQWYDARHFSAQQRDGNAVSHLHVAAAKQKRSLLRREVSALA